ncbi:cullin-like protein, putative [Plasmodium knowlesi strain H]|uniref:Cullin-like protein, putative n=3 Tax=Plasmodium knowlesi TaxID=5850 RepID=A0A5K1TW46_PLAKH|nr:cullin-like protein, putative [Plasmodium knowlesi strain H]OTN64493.1 putative Cullin-like protein [Plasmodium knowlesi]CAA9989025.1 cullin-like protein, putative [Plasmodium knowlesi strain H]SBO24869.1 cullin-like protein, putative [Plasmodium knowlesi strain H]SBO27551.1 cullin-like protein, putative [Plasmodium knowlesi strain H]VVS78499.1 cullin-like protein, putative [Plasmodium knowlesi strain H]|eukprot:XP_002261373.1 Cullin-like protein, putative [Plasmodium knowlesi strain H]
MDPSAYKNFPVFYLKRKESVNLENEKLMPNLNTLEDYINVCFSNLPYQELTVDNKKRFQIEGLCDFFVFYNCDSVICPLIEKQCKGKTLCFFNDLCERIDNKYFKNGDHFLRHFVGTWNNFSSVVVHLDELFKSFRTYNKISCSNFECPSYIFNQLWKKCINGYVLVKRMLILSACDYLKCDKVFCETKFYQYICMNMHDDALGDRENEGNGVSLSRAGVRAGATLAGGRNVSAIGMGTFSGDTSTVQNHWSVNSNKVNGNVKKCSVSFKIDESDNGKNCDNAGEEVKMGESAKGRGLSDTTYVSTSSLVNTHIGIENEQSDNIHANNHINPFDTSEVRTKENQIDDKLMCAGLRIIDMLGLYDEFEQSYKKDTQEYYMEKVKEHMSKEDTNTKNPNEKRDLPEEIENYLCHEQMRCRKFLKEETEIAILKMLKEELIVRNKDVLFKNVYIKHYIENEKYDSLRMLYLFSLHMNDTEKFCDIFFKAVEEIGLEIIDEVLKKRDNLNTLYDALIRLVNYKLNIDRVIIISFRYSSFFTNKWKEVFEHFLNKGNHAENYMPVILSIYLNNLLMMYNTGLKKLRKYYILNKQLRKGRSKKNDILFEKNWYSFCNESVIEGVEQESSISADSDTMMMVKKYLKKKKRKRKILHGRMQTGEQGSHCDNEATEKPSHSSDSCDEEMIHVHTEKMEKLFKKYHDVGKYIINTVTIILSLFKYLSDKEKFEKYYRTYMCKRLINDKNFNIVLDVKVFKTLKKECGPQFTKKIETILKDMKYSCKGMQDFYKEISHDGIKLLKKKKYSVNVIYNDVWEHNKLEGGIIYPEAIRLCNDYFCKYYALVNKAKNIKFLPLYGLCTLKVDFGKIEEKKYRTLSSSSCENAEHSESDNSAGKHLSCGERDTKGAKTNGRNGFQKNKHNVHEEENFKKRRRFLFTVTTLQATVLLLFNKRPQYSIGELTDLTGFSRDHLIEYLKGIYTGYETNILIYDEAHENFQLNVNFQTDNKYLVVNYSDQTYKDNTAIPALTQDDKELEDRTLHIDASIVKFLKTCGKASERDICAHTRQKVNNCTNEQIKSRLASLISREFIFLQNNIYYFEL